MLTLLTYIGFILWFLAGVSTGILYERKRRIKTKIKQRLAEFPSEEEILQKMLRDIEGMDLSNFDFQVSKNDVSKYRKAFNDLERKKLQN